MASLAKSGAISSVFVMYGAGAAFVATLIVSNTLGTSGAGDFFQVMALFAIGTSLSVFGSDTGLVRTVSAQKATGRYSAIKSLIRFAAIPSIGICLSISSLTIGYAWLMPGLSGSYRMMLSVTAAFLLCATFMTICFGVLRGLGKVVLFTALQNVLLPTLRIIAVFLVVTVAGNALALAFSWVIPVVIVAVVAFFAVRGSLPTEEDSLVENPLPAETSRSFWSFSSARGVSAVVESVLEWIDVLCVAAFVGVGASGIYGAVNRMVRVGVMVEHTGRIVTGPSISAALAVNDYPRAQEIFLGNTRALIALSWPFYLTLAFFGPLLLEIFGHGFSSGAGVLWVICPAMMVAIAAGGVQSVLLMSGKSRWQLYNKLSSLAVSLLLNFTLVPMWGLYGAVVAWSAAILVDTFLASYEVFFLVGIRSSLSQLLPVMGIAGGIPTVIALIVVLWMGVTWWALLLYLGVAIALYCAAILVFKKSMGLEKLFNKRPQQTRVGKHFATQKEV
ncbi:lipopolysaccharide biosynthesis protein [Rothia sp. P6271]|uniref:lipopolysaccharide biosynthesis protein n=1 Tax=unclassified Rothia (in: high G+C Gram-positive bacteria) TaxID=2689056 RepID=UPI003ACEEA64